jgi:hypothetical protein
LIVGETWHHFNSRKNFYRCKLCFNENKKQNPNFKDLNKPKSIPTCRVCFVVLNDENFWTKNFDTGNYICKSCSRHKSQKYQHEKKYNKIKTLNLKQKILDNYGSKCACCSIDVWQFLTIDHVNNDGAEERKKLQRTSIYGFLVKNNYPKDRYQILCMNCNYCKGHNGICAHKLKANINNCIFCDIELSLENTFNLSSLHKVCKQCLVGLSIKKQNSQASNRKRISKKKYSLNIKKTIIDAYGGSCVCCGESEPLFLTIDHINGGGRKHNEQIKKYGQDFYAWLYKNNLPQSEYRLLCYNCNCCHQMYGKCYHQLQRDVGIENITIDKFKELIKNNLAGRL